MGCCGKTIALLAVLIAAFLFYSCCLNSASLPVVEKNPWWGPGKPTVGDAKIRPFKINIPEKDLLDLKTRLNLPERLTPNLENSNFTYGIDSTVLKSIVDHWKNKYDWKAREKRLNQFSHFKTQIEGLDVHFIHAKPSAEAAKGKKVFPLLMVHGWPGSFVEFDEILPILVAPAEGRDFVFEVICPSIPGYGFSQAPSKMGFGAPQTGQLFLKLMKRLGKEKFYLQGGDWGSLIVSVMAAYYPDNILGMHSNMLSVKHPMVNLKLILGSVLPSGFMMEKDYEEILYPISKFISNIFRESGYFHLQATKPDTVGFALNDSPIGLAAYLLEKFSTWTNKGNPVKPDGGLLNNFPISLDRILDNISLYWFTQTITTSMRFYAENGANLLTKWKLDEIPTNVPAGFSFFKQEILFHPPTFASYKFKNILLFQKHKVGGHFAAMELPLLLADDVFKFVSLVEKSLEAKEKQEL